MLISSQIRAARALLDWSQGDLAEAASLSLPTIKRMESDKGPGSSTANNVNAVQRALETAGVLFILGNSEAGPGVRLSKPSAD